MASYSSDFQSYFGQTREEIILKGAEFKMKNEFLECNEAGYDLLILKDGAVLLDDDNLAMSFGDRGYNEDENDYELSKVIREDIYKLSQTLITQEKERLKIEEDNKN
jgi:hypothetical protein